MIRRLLVLAGALAAAVLLVAGCGGGAEAEPPDVRYGEDVCDQCGMIVSEARFAAAYVTAGGEVRRFDDVGDLLLYDAEHREDVAAYWVHDYETEDWLRAEHAWYILSPGIRTPMGHGLVAYAAKSEAEAKGQETGGEVLDWAAVRALDLGGTGGMTGRGGG